MLHAVIMAGGSGTRFWPQSRRGRPKQLLRLAGFRTMIQATVDRVATRIPPERTWVVTNRDQAEATAAQLPQLPPANLLIEPCGRNTAPCIGLAAIHLLHADSDAVMLVMPADHVIRPDDAFLAAVESAVAAVQQQPDALVLFGVPPTGPATGYGYIERGKQSGKRNVAWTSVHASVTDSGRPIQPSLAWTEVHATTPFRLPPSPVASFREKPDAATARQYLDAGNFYWNCGIFVWRAEGILAALGEFEPEIHERLLRLQGSLDGLDWEQQLDVEFPQIKSISIDYAVLERSPNVCVIEAPFEWDDVGSWESLPRLAGTDDAGNTVDARHVGLQTRRCIVRSTDDGHVVATVGVDDLIIVHTPDATLVARRGDEAGIRELVEELKARGYDDVL
jgi:mannose-1-phosphate guanylyltransferase